MTLDQIGILAEIISFVAVVASLLYVAIQLKQNTAALNSQSRQAVLECSQAELFQRVEFPEIDIATAKEGIPSPEEQVKISVYMMAPFRAREFSWLQYQNGAIDEAQWNTEKIVISVVLSPRRTQTWWEKISKYNYNPDFVSYVDSHILDHPSTVDNWSVQSNWADK